MSELDPTNLGTALGVELPTQLRGETDAQFRRRRLAAFQPHSDRWRDVRLDNFKGAALDAVERQVLADAQRAARDPSTVPPGTLREIRERDVTGRTITRFIGDPETCWGVFKPPRRVVTAWAAERGAGGFGVNSSGGDDHGS